MARMARLLRDQPAITERLFTPHERRYCTARRGAAEQHYAARFAAKEAVLKVFGTGLRAGMAWTDVEVANDRRGRPHVRLHGGVADLAARRRLSSLAISLSHTDDLAIAQAVGTFEE